MMHGNNIKMCIWICWCAAYYKETPNNLLKTREKKKRF